MLLLMLVIQILCIFFFFGVVLVENGVVKVNIMFKEIERNAIVIFIISYIFDIF